MNNLDGTRIDYALLVIEALRNRILCDDGLSGTGMRGYKNRLVPLDSIYGDLLKWIQRKFVFSRYFGRGNVA
jgi:hypothetical protein